MIFGLLTSSLGSLAHVVLAAVAGLIAFKAYEASRGVTGWLWLALAALGFALNGLLGVAFAGIAMIKPEIYQEMAFLMGSRVLQGAIAIGADVLLVIGLQGVVRQYVAAPKSGQ